MRNYKIRVREIIAECLEVPLTEVTLKASLEDDLGMDSISYYELYADVDEEFGTDISYEDIDKIVTVEDLIKYIGKNRTI